MTQHRPWHESTRKPAISRAVGELTCRPHLLAALVITLWVAGSASQVWAQAAIEIPKLTDWFNTIAWYTLVPILRILGAGIFIGGLVSLGGSRGGETGRGFAMMGAGGAILLIPEIVNAIYSAISVGGTWATQP